MPDDDDQNQNTPTPTSEQEEVDKGVEENTLLDIDARNYITIISTEIWAVYWRPQFCTTCSKPKVVHSPLVITRCPRQTITQQQRTRYE